MSLEKPDDGGIEAISRRATSVLPAQERPGICADHDCRRLKGLTEFLATLSKQQAKWLRLVSHLNGRLGWRASPMFTDEG
jgi:hypothetical protein